MKASSSPVFYEAENTQVDSQKNYILERNVLLMSSQKVFLADKASYHEEAEKAVLKGHVLGLYQNKVIYGDEVQIDFGKNLFSLKEGRVISQDNEELDKIKDIIWGLSTPSLEDQEKKEDFLRKLNQRKTLLYHETLTAEKSDENQKDILKRYESLLRLESSLHQKGFIKSSSKKQERLEVWKKLSRVRGARALNEGSSYFKIQGKEIHKVDEGVYEALASSIDFCDCEKDEKPAWGFQSSKLFLKEDDYVSLHDSVLEIKGFPVFYLPYLRLPLFSNRKPGLLFPSFSYSENSGFLYSQEVYFPLSDFADISFQYDFLSERGLRLKADPRIQFSNFSFLEASVETIRDRKWRSELNQREGVSDFYLKGLRNVYSGKEDSLYSDYRKDLSSEKWWNLKKKYPECFIKGADKISCLEGKVGDYLEAPSNTQRGKASWKGQYFYNESFSFQTRGTLRSDHRYYEDLEKSILPSYLSFFSQGNTIHFNQARNLVRWAHSYFTFKVGSQLSDPADLDKPFSGFQLPFYSNFRTRYISLFDFYYPRVYFRLSHDFWKLSLFQTSPSFPLSETSRHLSLGDGILGDLAIDVSIPLVYNQVFSLKYFFEAQGKYLYNEWFSDHPEVDDEGYKPSFLGKLISGVNFSLPVEGLFFLKEKGFFENSYKRSRSELLLRHRMTWNIDFSYRTEPLRSGPYGDFLKEYKKEKAGNKWRPKRNEEDFLVYTYKDKQFLFAEKSIKLSTFQSLASLTRTEVHQRPVNHLRPPSAEDSPFALQAEKELFGQNPESTEDGVSSESDEGSFQFLNLYSEISYDFEKANKKEKLASSLITDSNDQFDKIEPLSPWISELDVDLYYLTLMLRGEYSFSSQAFEEISLETKVYLPLSLAFTHGFSIKRELESSATYEDPQWKDQYKQSFGLSLPFFERSSFGYLFQIQTTPSEEEVYFGKGVKFEFTAPSKCWGWLMSWTMPLNKRDPYGTYYFSFYMNFSEKTFKLMNLASFFQDS